MFTLGNHAPSFDCSAVVDHELVELHWDQVHERRTLVLQFDSIENYADLPDDLRKLSDSVGIFERLQVNVAVVCRDHVFEILDWANRSTEEGGPGEIAFPFIVDSDDRIASMYDILSAEGVSLWGQIIIDPIGRVRHIALSVFPIGPNVDELIRCVRAIKG